MKPAFIEGPYLADLLAQPDALAEVRKHLSMVNPPSWKPAHFRLVLLTGMGASYHALLPLWQSLLAAGAPAVALETSELLLLARGLLRTDVLLLVVSQSGRGAEVVRLVSEAPPDCPILAVTNDPVSPLARRADFTVEIHAGCETSVSCKTYVNSLAALDWLGRGLLGEGYDSWAAAWEEVETWMRSYLRQWRRHAEEIARAVGGVSHFTIVGRASSLASAGTGALILKEAARVHAEALSAPAFRHGPIEAVGQESLTVILEGGPVFRERHLRLAMDIDRAGGRSLMISAGSERPALRVPSWTGYPGTAAEILPLQMITLAGAALRGTEAGRFRHAAKVTLVE